MPFFPATSRRSISREVTVGLILTVAAVSTISLLVAYGIVLQKAEAQLDAKAEEYLVFLKEILALPLWNYDFETINAVGQTYLQNDVIAGLQIRDHRGNIDFSAQNPRVVSSVTRKAQLFHYGIPIGAVQLSLTSGYYKKINRQYFWSFGLIVLINLFSLIIMTGLLLRWALKKPLRQMDNIVNAYAMGNYDEPQQNLAHIELKPLVTTLYEMGNRIKSQMSAIKKTEKKYRGIFENAMEGIFQSTLDGRIISANPAFAQILGYDSPEELISTVTDIGRQHYVDQEQRKEFVGVLQEEKVISSFETRLYREDGEMIWVSINARPIYDSRGQLQHFEGLVQDITLRKNTEAQIRQLSAAVEQVADNIMISDRHGRIAYVNPSFERNTGFSQAELLNRNPRVLSPDDREKTIYDDIWQTVSSGKTWTGRVISKKKDGDAILEDATASPIQSRSGQFLGYVSVNRDVTEKVKVENQLRQSQKMEAIGTLAGGISHDFNNILGVIIGCSELVLQGLSGSNTAKKDMETVLDAALRAKSLVRQILTFSRQSEGETQPLVLAPLIKEVVKFLRATLPTSTDIQLALNDSNSAVLADPIQVQQILMNLCTNSAHAMPPEGGELCITLTDVTLDVQEVSRLPELNAGPYVKLAVQDNGHGIPKDIIHRIFDPFFTTKRIGEGTGLGLSVVHGIVNKHRGAVFVDSTPGKGTIFKVFLPRLEHPDIEIVAEQISDLPKGTEQILLVDDEAILADILQRILSGLGYCVHAQTSSVKAYEMFCKNPDRFDLVISDQIMSDMTGTILTEKIRKIRPMMPVILCTGLKDEQVEIASAEAGVDRMLIKPIRRDELALVIREVLDE